MARASATRRAMPPESSAGMSSAAPRRPTACSLVSTSLRISGFGQIRVLAHRKGDVLEHVEVGQQCAVLEQHPHALAQGVDLAAAQGATSWPKREHLALLGADLARDQPQQRRLAGARGTHDRGDAPAANT